MHMQIIIILPHGAVFKSAFFIYIIKHFFKLLKFSLKASFLMLYNIPLSKWSMK